jgi:hypothetical protein
MLTDSSMVEATTKIWEHGGIAGFFGGIMYNTLRTFASAFVLVAYDQISHALTG